MYQPDKYCIKLVPSSLQPLWLTGLWWLWFLWIAMFTPYSCPVLANISLWFKQFHPFKTSQQNLFSLQINIAEVRISHLNFLLLFKEEIFILSNCFVRGCRWQEEKHQGFSHVSVSARQRTKVGSIVFQDEMQFKQGQEQVTSAPNWIIFIPEMIRAQGLSSLQLPFLF